MDMERIQPKKGQILANHDIVDERGNTALHVAAGIGLVELCIDLVENFGADVWAKNEAGLRAVDLALNMQEQLYSYSKLHADYDEVVRYLDSCCCSGEDSRFFHRDNYELFAGNDNH